jgi:hypothetical protein
MWDGGLDIDTMLEWLDDHYFSFRSMACVVGECCERMCLQVATPELP